jgi:hypothetical protein
MAKKRILGYLLVGVVAAAILEVSAAEIAARIERRRAERVFADVKQLVVGKSTYEEARAMMLRHRGVPPSDDHASCSREHCTFEVKLRHDPPLAGIWSSLRYDWMVRLLRVACLLGLQDWWCGASVTADQGVVTRVGYGVAVRRSAGWVLGRETDEFKTMPGYLGRRSHRIDRLNMTTFGGGEALKSTLDTKVTAAERSAAYDYNFDCLTKLGGCSSMCQFAPRATADYVKQTRSLPYLEEADPTCADFKPREAKP